MSHRTRLHIVIAAMSIGLPACRSDTMVGGASRPTLRFTPDLTVSGLSAPTDSLAVSVQVSAIELAGRIRVPDRCNDLTATLVQRADTFSVTVDARRNAAASCYAVVVGIRYAAEVRPATRGAFVVQVLHRVRASDGRLVETSSLPLQQVEFR